MDHLHCNEKGVKMMRSLLCLWLLSLSAAQEQKNITAESGQNVTLTCRATNSKSLTGVEWRRDDLKPEYVLVYRDEQFDPEAQNPSFKNRVDLQDRQMKDGDVSLILKKVTAADEGTYECRALRPGRVRAKRAFETVEVVTLRVVDPSGQGGGTSEDGGKKDGGKEDGGKKDGGSVGLIAAVAVLAVVAAAAAGFVIYRKRSRNQSQASSQPSSVELLPVETV